MKVLYKGKVEKYKGKVGTILGEIGTHMTLVDFKNLGSIFVDNKNLQPYDEEMVCLEDSQSEKEYSLVGLEGERDLYLSDEMLRFLEEESNKFRHINFNKKEGAKEQSKDPINPSHYKQGIEVYDFIKSHDMNFAQGNAIKYISRYQLKNGVEDLKKAKWYLEKLIEELEGK